MTSTTNHADTAHRSFSVATFFLGLAFVAQLAAATLGITQILGVDAAPSLVITGVAVLAAGGAFARFTGRA